MHLDVNVNGMQWINIIRIIEYHFVSLHELFECVVGNNVEVWITNKDTQTLCNLFIFCDFQSQSRRFHCN
jgi:hypothetical protein